MVENISFRIKEFEKFYYFLTKNAPPNYIAWFFPCEKLGKNPSIKAILKINPESKGSWHHISARLNKEQCIEHIKQNYNIGISARKDDPLIIGDIDNPKYLNQIPSNTLIVTSRKRVGSHFFGWNKDGTAKINLPTDDGEIRSDNEYVLASGSYVPFDLTNEKEKKVFDALPEEAKKDEFLGYYTVKEAIIPRELSFGDFPQFFKQKEIENIEAEVKIKEKEEFKIYQNGKYSQLFKLKVSDIVGLIPPTKRFGHPLHESETDTNFSISKDGTLGHCWRHLVSLNAIQYLCVQAGYSKCVDAGTPHKNRGISKIKGDKKALEVAYNEAIKIGLISKTTNEIKPVVQAYFNKTDLTKQILEIQPIHYDENRVWWIWNKEKLKWEVSDDTAILNFVRALSEANTIQAKEKQEIVEAIKQESRLRKPEPIQKTWIQFVDKIVDIKTGEEMDVSPKYFVTNPIPYRLHPDRFVNTPTMDRIFEEWVGKDYVKTLYEIIAYCLVPDYPIHRLFCLIGGGLNGKGCFLRLLKKFIGDDNVTSTELDVLLGSRFEVTRLHKKLICMMGETNFNEMRQTSILKKLTGQDLIGFEYKNKNPFTDDNYAKILIATNNLPTTTDKTIGFYRRWMIVDFPNRFSEAKDILSEIPEEEYEALAVKSLIILKDLLDKRAFTNEGTIEERTERYEAKSNFLDKFLSLFVDEDLNSFITKADFIKKFSSWSKENKHREMSETSIGLEMKKRNYESSRKNFDWMNDGRGGQARVWLGVKWKE